MGRQKANKRRRPRPQQSRTDCAAPYEDRGRRALCRVCGGDVLHERRLRRGAEPLIVVTHADNLRDENHAPDLVWVWAEVDCDFCGGNGVVWSYHVAPLATARPVWLTPQQEVFDAYASANETPWTACERCAGLIEAEQWDALVQACVSRLKVETGQIVDANGTEAISGMHRQFIAMRTGARVPYAASA